MSAMAIACFLTLMLFLMNVFASAGFTLFQIFFPMIVVAMMTIGFLLICGIYLLIRSIREP